MGFSKAEIDDLSEGEAYSFLEAFDEIVNPDKRRKMTVRKPVKGKRP
jgi:hypothetical protein